jgi:DNA-binding LacI/PurR family transcriptional regulator
MKREITIKDIARELNIHHTTVSRALRNGRLVKKETLELIKKKAKELGYQPNLLAQGFRNKRSNAIAVLVPDLKQHFFANFISNFSTEANASGYSVMGQTLPNLLLHLHSRSSMTILLADNLYLLLRNR